LACKKQWVTQVFRHDRAGGAKVSVGARFAGGGPRILSRFAQKNRYDRGDDLSQRRPAFRRAHSIQRKRRDVHEAPRLHAGRDSMSIDVPFFISELPHLFDYFFENSRNEKNRQDPSG